MRKLVTSLLAGWSFITSSSYANAEEELTKITRPISNFRYKEANIIINESFEDSSFIEETMEEFDRANEEEKREMFLKVLEENKLLKNTHFTTLPINRINFPVNGSGFNFTEILNLNGNFEKKFIEKLTICDDIR